MINHKWSEDIFAKNQTIAEGKNHGIVIFVDWSGSMGNNIEQTVKQAIILAMFAKQAGIPFEVYAFSDRRLSTAGMPWLQEKKYAMLAESNGNLIGNSGTTMFRIKKSRMSIPEKLFAAISLSSSFSIVT